VERGASEILRLILGSKIVVTEASYKVLQYVHLLQISTVEYISLLSFSSLVSCDRCALAQQWSAVRGIGGDLSGPPNGTGYLYSVDKVKGVFRQSWYDSGELQYYYLGVPAKALLWRVNLDNTCDHLGRQTDFPYDQSDFTSGFMPVTDNIFGTVSYIKPNGDWFYVTKDCLPLGHKVTGWGGVVAFYNTVPMVMEDLSIPSFCT